MEPIQKRAQIDPQQLIPGKAGLAKSYSRARNGAVTRESQARGGRSEEVQAERKVFETFINLKFESMYFGTMFTCYFCWLWLELHRVTAS